MSKMAEDARAMKCCDELRDATEAFNDAAVNNLFTLPEAIKLVKRILSSQSRRLMFQTAMGAESEETMLMYNEHNQAVETLRSLADGGLMSVLSRIDGSISVE
jgi:hypothetical protein